MKKWKIIAAAITCLAAIYISYLVGFDAGCRKIIGNNENIGLAMDVLCYGPNDFHQEALKNPPPASELPPPPKPGK